LLTLTFSLSENLLRKNIGRMEFSPSNSENTAGVAGLSRTKLYPSAF